MLNAMPLHAPEQAFNAPALHHNAPTGNQTNQPEDSEDKNRHQQKLRVMQERQGIVSQESDIGVVDQGGEVEGISEECGQEIAGAAGEQRKQQELHHVEVQVEWEEGSVGDL